MEIFSTKKQSIAFYSCVCTATKHCDLLEFVSKLRGQVERGRELYRPFGAYFSCRWNPICKTFYAALDLPFPPTLLTEAF